MASGPTHTATGVLTGLGMALNGQNQGEAADPLLTVGTTTLFAKLPDWIEPASTPNHRQFFHSFAVLGMAGYGVKKVYDWNPSDQGGRVLRYLALCAAAGYISHLVLDGFTPQSLPLVGKV